MDTHEMKELISYAQLLLQLAFIAYNIVCMWLIFQKGGEAGWKALIPFYNRYTLCRYVGHKKYFILTIIAAIVMLIGCILDIVGLCILLIGGLFGFLGLAGAMFGGTDFSEGASAIEGLFSQAGGYANQALPYLVAGGILLSIGILLSLIYHVLKSIALADLFGLGAGFALGLIFLSPIFMGILAFGRSTPVRAGYERYQPL